MDSQKNKIEERTTHDFFGERTWLIYLVGYANSSGLVYKFLRGTLVLGCIFNYSMSLSAAVLVPGIGLQMLCVHTCVISVYSMWLISTRIIVNKSLNESRNKILKGIYNYDDEETDVTETNMRKTAVNAIVKRGKVVTTTFAVMGTYALILLPISQFLLSSDDDVDPSNGVLNKYLPYPIYMPFNTHTFIGYVGGMLFNVHYVLTAFGNGIIFSQIYISCTVQLQAHLKILNHSLRNIEKRAYLKFTKTGHYFGEVLCERLYQNQVFQDCLFTCLQANARHHQSLLRFHKEFQPCIGSGFFLTAFLGSVSYACTLFVILQHPPVNLLIIYVVTFLTEFVYNHFICYIAQQLLDESSALFESLFSTPWYLCDKRFCRVLHIMMCSTLKPIQIKAILLNFTASVSAHGDLISAMYKLTNLLRR